MEIASSKRFYIDVAIIFGLMFGFGFLPPIDPITAQGMRILGILFGCIYAWTIGSLIWPSLVALLAMGFMPDNSVAAIFTAAFGNPTLLMVLFCLIFCACVEGSGVLAVVANFILTRKFVRRGPWWLAFGFFAASCIASIFVGQPAVSIFLWAIFIDVAKKSGLKPKSIYVALVMIGIVIVGYLGSAVMPYGLFLQVGIAIMTAVNPGFVMNYFGYMILDLIICIVMVPAITLFFKLICPKFEYNLADDIAKKEKVGFNREQKITLLCILLVVILLIAPSFLPKDTAIYAFVNNFGIAGGMCAVSVLMMLIVINGKTIGDIGQVMVSGIPWGLYFLLAAALSISTMITAPGTGVSEFLKMAATPIFSGKNALIFMALLVLIGAIITNCINNAVTMTLMIPLGLTFAAAYGVSPQRLVAVFAIILYQGVVLPSGSVLGALLHGQREWLTAKQIYIYASLGELLLTAVMVLIGVPIGMYVLF